MCIVDLLNSVLFLVCIFLMTQFKNVALTECGYHAKNLEYVSLNYDISTHNYELQM